MEYRHAVSEPRPVEASGCYGNLLSWEVDILRDDKVIVDTFLLNRGVLPPRTNKKGKVIWRLPDTFDKLPSFGTDDRRRVLDIFKERKKRRKHEKKKRNLSSQGGESFGGEKGSDTGEQHDSGSSISVGTKVTSKENELQWKETSKSFEKLSLEQDGHGDATVNGKERKHNKKHGQEKRGREMTINFSNIPQHSQPSPPFTPPPPGIGASPEQAPEQSQSRSNQLPSRIPCAADPARMSTSDAREVSTLPQPQPTHDPPLSPHTSFHEPPTPDALFVTVPRRERLDPLPGRPPPSFAVPAARHFISTYYAHFGAFLPGVHVGNLIRYYTASAQKSVSIGGAHAVVTGRTDIAAQILNFAGTEFAVRGVVAQDTADGKGVHILVTGTARTVGGVVASFAHSLSLVLIHYEMPSDSHANTDGQVGEGNLCPALLEAVQIGYPFLIHNDALALLTAEAGSVTPTPVQPPVQMPPPPPGLF